MPVPNLTWYTSSHKPSPKEDKILIAVRTKQYWYMKEWDAYSEEKIWQSMDGDYLVERKDPLSFIQEIFPKQPIYWASLKVK